MIGLMAQAGQDAFSFWQRAAETAAASAFVIDRRTRLMTPGRVPTPADLAEMAMMVPEKLAAFGLAGIAWSEAWLAMGAAGWGAAGAALDPIHARATANARRLRRR